MIIIDKNSYYYCSYYSYYYKTYDSMMLNHFEIKVNMDLMIVILIISYCYSFYSQYIILSYYVTLLNSNMHNLLIKHL